MAKAKTTVKAKGKTAAKPAAKGKASGRPAAKAAPKAKAPAKPAAKPAAPAAPPPAWAWHEVMTNDVAGAKAFYTGLFGWSAQDLQMPTGAYTLFMKGSEQVAGCMAIPSANGQPACPPNWLSYLRVDDVDATVTRARALGARVDVAGMDIPGIGRFAVLGDPAGATFAVFQGA
ncbi:MAG: VOC family protein [Planctomycetota bacterium]